jgi:competence protein ComEA
MSLRTSLLCMASLGLGSAQANTALYLDYDAWKTRQQQHDVRLREQPPALLQPKVVQLATTVAAIPAAPAKVLLGPATTVNINRADAAELQAKLTGVGPQKAQAIVAYRQQHGAFQRAEDLQNVKGIGPKTFEKNKDKIKLQD